MDISSVRSGHTPSLPEIRAGKKAEPAETPAQNETPNPKDVHQAVQKLQAKANTSNGQIEFSIDQDSGREIVKVVDRSTKDILMQFPSKQALALAKSIDDSGNGSLINHKT